MGIVYLAREVRLARRSRSRCSRPRSPRAPSCARRSCARRRPPRALTHPNIVPVYAAGERGGFVYIVMAFVEGITLGERIRTRGPLLPGQAARVLREVAWALAYAHGARHRASRRQRREHPARARHRARDRDRLRHRQRDADRRARRRRPRDGQRALREPRAGRRRAGRRAQRSLLARRRRLLRAHRPPALRRRDERRGRARSSSPPPRRRSRASRRSVPPRLAAAVDRCLPRSPIRRYRSAESFAEAIDLAFEHAKEIPAPLRVWLSQGQKRAAGAARVRRHWAR